MDDFDLDADGYGCPVPETLLFGTVRVRVTCRATGRPLEGVRVSVADSPDAALGRG